MKGRYIYLHPASDGLELYKGLKEYMYYYNYELHHQEIERKTPAERLQQRTAPHEALENMTPFEYKEEQIKRKEAV